MARPISLMIDGWMRPFGKGQEAFDSTNHSLGRGFLVSTVMVL
jgi:hypothetical protein